MRSRWGGAGWGASGGVRKGPERRSSELKKGKKSVDRPSALHAVDMLGPSGSLLCLESKAKRIMLAEISIYSSVQKWLLALLA